MTVAESRADAGGGLSHDLADGDVRRRALAEGEPRQGGSTDAGDLPCGQAGGGIRQGVTDRSAGRAGEDESVCEGSGADGAFPGSPSRSSSGSASAGSSSANGAIPASAATADGLSSDGPSTNGHGPRGTPGAEALAIAGLVPLSTVDWPGRLAATVFCQGCPWNCFYCHNRALIDPRTPGVVAWRQVRELLARRRGLLDGLVFTGGEALRQAAVADAAAEVKRLGFAVGLHTAGCYPTRLRELVARGLVDWVGLDVKALPEHYSDVVGRNAGTKAWQSLTVLAEAAGRGGPDFEVRTTVVPGDVTADDAYEVARRVREAGAQAFALQQARGEGASGQFAVTAPGWDEECQRLAERIEALGWRDFAYRPA